jgi:hypothetical protein
MNIASSIMPPGFVVESPSPNFDIEKPKEWRVYQALKKHDDSKAAAIKTAPNSVPQHPQAHHSLQRFQIGRTTYTLDATIVVGSSNFFDHRAFNALYPNPADQKQLLSMKVRALSDSDVYTCLIHVNVYSSVLNQLYVTDYIL